MRKSRELNKKLREPLRGTIEPGTEDFLCRWCTKEVPIRRRTFCSNECVHEHRLRSNIDYMRKNVFKRDKGICVKCGLDCENLKYEAVLLLKESDIYSVVDFLVSYSIPMSRIKNFINRNVSLWDADHKIPVRNGGGGCGLEGMQTLCSGCHTKLTKEQQKQEYIGYIGNTLWDDN